MPTRLPTSLPRRPTASLTSPSPLCQTTTTTTTTTLKPSHTPLSHTPSRAATLIKRPRRPYSFTQLIQLSDGSTYTMRTSSPAGMYRSTKDVRNHVLWQPNNKSLKNVEVDEAGKLAAFRQRFGTSWDAASPSAAAEGVDGGVEGGEGAKKGADATAAIAPDAPAAPQQAESDALADLIAGYAKDLPELRHISPKAQAVAKGGKKK
ncbi:hypothetical protein F5Y16DRAFT_46082 [Xylariaceae sp. FL0255]|nr:hypothetical protein F5Y16DRAFT_46082 [Xylariaceae sp. FL0255]